MQLLTEDLNTPWNVLIWQARTMLSFVETMGMDIDPGNIISPMHCWVLKINISTGGRVQKKGKVLMVVELMKMENNILSPADGVVDKLLVKEGDMVDGSARLIHLN